ncbi:MAG TPA: hypothetical protein VFF06_28290 [Polyangia bacterium]|nr:hypothetical protein [Polyangia bacterium]
MSRAWLVASTALFASGCATAYLQATGQFAVAAREGAGSLASAFDLSTQLCRDRADLAYLLPRLKAEYGAEASFGAAPLRSVWWTDKSGGTNSWADHCGAIEAADGAHRNGLQVIIAYGWALQSVVGQGQFQGDDLRSVASSAAQLTQKIGGGGAAGYTGAIAGVGTPITMFTDFLLSKIVANDLRKDIGAADPAFQKVLDKLLAYVDASGELQLLDLTETLGEVLDEIEGGLGAKGALADPVRGIAYYDFAAHWEARLRYYRHSIDATKKVIQDLKAAHNALRSAGDGDGAIRTDDLKKMGGFAAAVIADAAYFRAQIAASLGTP